MSCTAVSTLLEYNSSPVATTHCGEVYCSQNLEYFLINCTTCSKEFNLLSCNLFIKHIKECLSSRLPDRLQNIPNQEISNYAIDSLLKDALKNNIVDDVQSTDSNHLIPLKALKVETTNETEYVLCPSDYQDEDDLTIDKVSRRRVIEGIIDEYKKLPLLWDVNLKGRTNQAAQSDIFKQFRKAINSKFKKNYTDAELRTQISNLRSEYRKVLQKNADGNGAPLKPQLWYFDKISFIGHTDNSKETNVGENDFGQPAKQEASDDIESSNSSIEHTVRGPPKKKQRERPNCKVLSEPKTISEIIAQYKKYSFLWDQTASLYSDKHARKDAFRKISSCINKKFHKNVTDKEIRRQIVNLRSVYRRAQRKKHRADYRVSLWYYDDLSFIDKRSDQAEVDCEIAGKLPIDDEAETKEHKTENLNNSDSDEEEPFDQQFDDYDDDNNDQEDDNAGSDNINDDSDEAGESLSCRRKRDKKIILSLIEEYKQHPCLWNNYLFKTSSRFDRNDAKKAITSAINAKFKKNFTVIEIRNKLVQLRSGYRRVLRKKEAFEKKHANAKRKFHSQLWYFDKMSFIGATDSAFSVSRRKEKLDDPCKQKEGQKQKQEDAEMEEDKTSESDEDSNSNIEPDYLQQSDGEEQSDAADQDDNSTNQFQKSITKNRELLTGIIEEYKKLPVLWAVQYYSNDNVNRRKAFRKMAKIINEKFNTQFTYKDLSQEISKLRCTYKRMLRRRHECPDGEFKTKMWYADLLSFIEKSADNAKEDIQLDYLPENDTLEGEGKFPTKSKEHIFEIIELYKSEPVLWNNKHHQHMLWSERRKAIEKIIATLSQEHDCHLTVEEFRYQIRFLRESYFRAVRDEISAEQGDVSNNKYAPKPFFYDQMSFLVPFSDQNCATVPKMGTSSETDLNQDFSFLVENRPLMMDFIELYKTHGCLWDQKHKDRNNLSAHSDAYDKIINMFLENNIIFSKEKVMSAVSFLYSTVVSTQKAIEFRNDDSNKGKSPIWFYEHLTFLGNVCEVKDNYCTHCDQYFCTLNAYEKHKMEINRDYPYKCAVCNAGFVSRSKYAFHQITHKEPSKCEQCGFQTFDKYNFNVHMRRHKGIHSYRCEYCEKGFVTSTELNRHLRMHTGEKPFICDICGKALQSNSNFQQHMKRHRNQRDHKCELCGSAFYTLTTLRDHMAKHSTEREHVCEVCGAAFKRKKTLHQHKSLHLERKKHECKICGKLFAQQAGVYSHMKSHGLMAGS